jgi:hypothetical protein
VIRSLILEFLIPGYKAKNLILLGNISENIFPNYQKFQHLICMILRLIEALGVIPNP